MMCMNKGTNNVEPLPTLGCKEEREQGSVSYSSMCWCNGIWENCKIIKFQECLGYLIEKLYGCDEKDKKVKLQDLRR